MIGNANFDVVIEGVVQPGLVPEIGRIGLVFIILVPDLADGFEFLEEGNAKGSDRFDVFVVEPV